MEPPTTSDAVSLAQIYRMLGWASDQRLIGLEQWTNMSLQSEALRRTLDAVKAMREAGYTQEDIQELVAAAFEHIEDDDHQPYAYGRCTECGRVIVGWSPYRDPPPGS